MTLPLKFPDTAKFYILVKKDSVTGYMSLDMSASISSSGAQMTGAGFFLYRDDAEKQQILLALKGEKTNLYELEWPL